MDPEAAANASDDENPVDDSAPLAQVEALEEVNLEWIGRKVIEASMRTLVSVRKCPHGSQSRLGYHANLFLTLPGAEEKDIGYIKGWRISRPSGINPTIDPQYLMAEWYFKPLREYDQGAKEMAYCIRALYGKGQLPIRRISDRIVNSEKEAEVRDGGNELVFIEEIYIKYRENQYDPKTQYSGWGLAAYYLDTYYRLLGGKILPAWFSLTGPVTYLLLPRFHPKRYYRGTAINQGWRDLRRENNYSAKQLEQEVVPQRLTKLFQKETYQYERYIINADVEGADITVMGHAVEPVDTISDVRADYLILDDFEDNSFIEI